LNSGAGGIGGIFVHEKHTEKGGNSQFPMLQGWWGNNIKTKFLMKDGKHSYLFHFVLTLFINTIDSLLRHTLGSPQSETSINHYIIRQNY
jgi:hypothetical protein